ncbi:RNA polymerase II subunit 5-mediating protein homolog [Fopius arisanus]|uniref:RNA polymerase II subunit 5-mediating protein homolog n=1 Tax=Fopius arisanus TaxID=64838 RepID=A0A0C9Q2L3_9HYME|nr:PREDICTED: RNA polymerase II subunit 5-mediating protein homolog [Fopius arisanus]
MDYEQLQTYQQQILAQALNEGVRRNNEQVKIWSDYKTRHEKVLEGLGMLPQNLSVNCMVPVGRRALIPGKLVHTNEIMVCLGDGYFAKYSAAQAIALCNRRIQKANEMLGNLEKERNLFEMKQMLTDTFDVFGDNNKKDLQELWDNEKLENWRDEHRRREKEYREKLVQLKNEKKEEIKTEEDLFKRLDALELQEELEDELYKLEEENPEFYTQQFDDDQYYDESEVDSESYSSDYSEEATNEIKERKSTKLNHRLQVLNSVNTCQLDMRNEENDRYLRHSRTINYISTNGNEVSPNECQSFDVEKAEGNKIVDRLEVREKKVAFAEPQVKYFSNEEEMEVSTDKRRVSVIEQRLYEYWKEDDESEDESDEDDTIRIYIKHSDKESDIPTNQGTDIVSPRDIYKLIPGPKSILKKTSNHCSYSKEIPPLAEVTTEESSENEVELISAYNTIVKEIKEHTASVAPAEVAETPLKRVSKFKMERAGLNK